MFLSKRMDQLKPSPTLMLSAKAKQLKQEGHDVVDLCVGEPDFETPSWVKEKAIDAIHKGYTRYTPVDGIEPLKKAIQKKTHNDYGLTYELANITCANGAKQILFNALMATLNLGDEVIIPSPYWVSYPEMVQLFEGIPKIIPCSQENHFKLTPEQLKNAITDKTKWLIFNSPSNPTGSVYTKDELQAIAEVLLESSIWVLSDDIYDGLVYDGPPIAHLLAVEPALKDRVVLVHGVSKTYAMTGWRIGYGVGPAPLIKAMTMLQSQSSSNPCSISQHAAVAALSGNQSFLNEWRSVYTHKRNLAHKMLNEIEGVSCILSMGAFYLYPSCAGLIGKKTPSGKVIENDSDLCAYLLEEGKVATVPGSAFGLSPHIRISYALDEESLVKAMTRMKEVFSKLY